MKSFIKNLSLMLVMMLPLVSCADNDKPIPFEQLPAAAQQMVKKHFAAKQVALVTLDKEFMKKSYNITFSDGTKLEFDGNGEWKDIDCQQEAVPAALVPKQIADYVKKAYAQAFITELSLDRKGYEVKLSNQLELKFNKQMVFVGVDD